MTDQPRAGMTADEIVTKLRTYASSSASKSYQVAVADFIQQQSARLSALEAGLREAMGALETIRSKCPATCDMTLAHEMSEDAERALTTLASLLKGETAGERYRHKVRGTEYDVLHREVELQSSAGPIDEGALLVIYRGSDGRTWARRASEFGDGRFDPLPPPPLDTKGA